MSSTIIGKVAAVFTASTSGLVTGVNTAKSTLGSLSSSIDGVKTRLNVLTGIQGAALFGSIATGAGNAARSLAGMVDATADVIDAQAKMAAKVGVPLDAFAALSEAADEVGVSQSSIARAMGMMGQSLLKLENGEKKATAAFKSLGLSAKDLAGLSPEEAFGKIADEIAKIPTPAGQTAKAIEIFGKVGKELRPMFEGGSTAIRAATEEVRLFGTALDTQSGQNVTKMKNAFGDLAAVFEGFKTQVVAAFAPAVTTQIEALLEQIKNAGGMREVALQFAELVGGAVVDMTDGALAFAKIIKEALGLVQETFSGVSAVVSGFYALGQRAVAGGQLAAGLAIRGSVWDDDGASDAWIDAAQRSADAAKAASDKADSWWNGTDAKRDEQESAARKALRENIERMRAAMQEKPAEKVATRVEDVAKEKKECGKAGIADLLSKAGVDPKVQQDMLAQLRIIAAAAGVPERPTPIFQLSGAGGR